MQADSENELPLKKRVKIMGRPAKKRNLAKEIFDALEALAYSEKNELNKQVGPEIEDEDVGWRQLFIVLPDWNSR